MTRSTSTGSRLMRWLQRGAAARPRPEPQPDPADMGTCYGLEMSLDDAPIDPFARPDRSASSAPAGVPWSRTAPRGT